MEQPDLFPNFDYDEVTVKNPMVRAFGAGPADKRCKSCKHLTAIRPGQNVYHKCRKRGITHGPGTDHRVNWPSCSKYEVEENA